MLFRIEHGLLCSDLHLNTAAIFSFVGLHLMQVVLTAEVVHSMYLKMHACMKVYCSTNIFYVH